MPYTQGIYPILKKDTLAKNTFGFHILCPQVATEAKAGQFVHVKSDGFFLRRPISICEADKTGGTIRIVFEIRGEGTKKLAELNEGDNIDMIAPIGNGFSCDKQKTAVVIGGGIGVPPMLETLKGFSDASAAILGFKSARAVILENDFAAQGKTLVCTDDGSYGEKGLVTDLLKKYLANNSADIICACGPAPMLKGVIAVARENSIACEVSLEERMGCGIGACLGCACKTKNTETGEEHLSHVCKNGPVFNGEEVVL